ncbi:GNAT family N-acetyltransferase [Actinomyces respiraculi]|uniref:GNAT family N-acetyltransferase n=1 Tax=Actinomyces respiraculi TaxID=2744574 RepID=UPI00142358AC|nr:GNAT family N-acetyltransferase [Actinomyces respiraculi]
MTTSGSPADTGASPTAGGLPSVSVPSLPSVFSTAADAGLSAPARGGLQEAHAHPAEAGGFVRPATQADLEVMGRVQAQTMLASLGAAHAAGHDGAALPEGIAAMIAPPVLAAGWEQAVTEPPSPAHHVLVATLGEEVVGLAGVAPTEGVAVNGEGAPTSGEPQRAAEVTALGVAPAHQRQGHGSRLLAAAGDLARQDGARVLLAWALRGDESLAAFLSAAGLERTASHRLLPVGQGVVEELWLAEL